MFLLGAIGYFNRKLKTLLSSDSCIQPDVGACVVTCAGTGLNFASTPTVWEIMAGSFQNAQLNSTQAQGCILL